jgi:hypothetical protein
VIPISLGPVPSGISGACAIDPFETDNLLDATQRHFSMDWNTVVAGPETVSTTSLGPHAVDTPSHPPLSADGQSGDGENMAGDVLIRNYLAPPGQQNQVQAPYVIVRDVNTGCPYPVSWLTTGGNNWVYAPAPQQAQPNCSTSNGNTPGAGCGAIFSTVDLSCPPTHPGCGVPNWLDTNQQSLHSNFTQITPQGCYTNGNTVNDLAWVRSPEWVGRPGPDDSYLSAAVSATDLTYAANHVKALMLQFQLPDMPAIPCAVGQGCSLSGNEQLRYLSLSFVQQQSSAGVAPLAMDPDGIQPLITSSGSTIVSVADSAFCSNSGCTIPVSCLPGSPCYVSLVVGIGPSVAGVNGGALTCVTTGGFAPALNSSGTCAVRSGGGYTVLDLSQFTAAAGCTTACFSTTQNLQIVMRETLPNVGNFACSGSTAPFSAAEYTPAGGSMGPYVPQISQVVPAALPSPAAAPTLPPASACGALPSSPPVLTTAAVTLSAGSPVQWPTFWPGTDQMAPPQTLACPPSYSPNQPTAPTINFITSLLPAEDWSNCPYPGPTQACNYAYALQTQTDAYAGGLQPPLALTVVGSGFGYLPEILPYVVRSSYYLEIRDDMSGGGTWDTGSGGASCEMYIANWTDTTITVIGNLPIKAYNAYYGNVPAYYLSPLTDASPLTLFPSPYHYNIQGCPIGNGDTLTVSVTNPQAGGSPAASSICVGTPGIGACGS